MSIQREMANPNLVFASPETLESSAEYTVSQKRAILVQWKNQLEQLLVADEEGMFRTTPKVGSNADCLRRITDILTRLPS
jgi:hypothetical protein